jgi:hypothetical protein
MTIADNGQLTRAEQVRSLLGPDAALPAALGEQFQLRWFRFSRRPERMKGVDGLAFAGNRSDLSTALDDVRRELAALPLAGLVLVTDGADNADSAITRSVLSLTAAGVPVYTVGVGEERFPTDLELSRVTAPRRSTPRGIGAGRSAGAATGRGPRLGEYRRGGKRSHSRDTAVRDAR